ncbi:CRO protein [Ignicoccus pacificus DSM 13166]|uniref:CRO protein n=1 Tax=Ignicoccus pacificus DSM 13166 TaxID=940294 RepID=A0A977K902_9CREN|nr:CRO protein [Ignicoccus pacificus DSM 13166]
MKVLKCVQVRLREWRARYRVSQESLARAVGVTRQTIIAIEKGRYLPSLELALKIAKFFNAKVEDIFVLKEECYPKETAL